MSFVASQESHQKLSIPQERPSTIKKSIEGMIPQSMIDHQISCNRKNFREKAEKQTACFASPDILSDNNLREQTTDHNLPPIDQQNVVIDFELHKPDVMKNPPEQKISFEDPCSNPDLIENEQTAAMNHSQEYKKKAGSLRSIPKINSLMNDSLGPKLVLSRFAVRKNEINLTTSIQQNGQSNPNRSNNLNSKENEQIYSGSQGWMHSQFNPQLDSNIKKEMYVIQKMVEFQFDPVVAKGVLEQMDIEKYSREEIVQMVCETMLNHRDEQRIGKRVIDKIQQSKFVHKLISQRNIPKSSQAINSVMLDIPPNVPQPSQQNFYPASSIGNSVNSHNLNVPSAIGNNNNNQQNSFQSKKDGRDKSPNTKNGKRTISNINSHIFSMPITHSQKYIKIENNVPDKVDNKLYSCDICCMEYLGTEFYRLTSCSHNFCMSCTQTYLLNKINKSEVLNIICPQAGCGVKVQDFQIQKVLHPEVFDRYMKFKKIMVLNQDPQIRWCPVLDCETYMRGDKDKPCLQCPRCQQKMCFLCNNKWHEGQCEDAMNRSLVDMKEKLKIELCPQCKGRIQKFEGCNHMKCWICSYEFCWLCKKQYSKWHYKSWNIIGCPDQMFSDEQLEGIDKFCLQVSTLLRLLFFFVLMLMGGTAALSIYIILMFAIALVLPLLIAYHYFKPQIEKLSCSSTCLVWVVLLAAGIFLYPMWLILCFIPGTCIFGPEIYMYILFIIYNEDMYN